MRNGWTGTMAILLAGLLGPLAAGRLAAADTPAPPAAAPPTASPSSAPVGVAPGEGCPEAGSPLCGDGCCKPCCELGGTNLAIEGLPGGCFWVSADYLLWWVKNAPSPGPILTTGPASAGAAAGTLGAPGTTTLFGGSSFDYGPASGARVSAGIEGPDHRVGIDFSAFLLERTSTGFGTSSDAGGNPVIAQPFFDALTGQPARLLAAFPGAFAGSATVVANSQLWGAEANVTKAGFGWVGCGSNVEVDFLCGFRYLDLTERLEVNQTSTVLANGIAPFAGTPLLAPAMVTVADGTETRNRFYGLQLGTHAEFKYGDFFVTAIGKVALGDTHEVVGISGLSTASTGGVPLAATGGLTAVGSNLGRQAGDNFAVVPEVSLNVGYELWSHVRVYAGWTFLYWSRVARPGDQLSSTINSSQVPTSPNFGTPGGSVAPLATRQSSDFWAEGLQVGVAVHF